MWMTTPSGANPNWENIIQRWKSSEIMEPKRAQQQSWSFCFSLFSLSLSLSHTQFLLYLYCIHIMLLHSFCSISIVYISCYSIVFALSLLYTYHATYYPHLFECEEEEEEVCYFRKHNNLFACLNFKTLMLFHVVLFVCLFVCLFFEVVQKN